MKKFCVFLLLLLSAAFCAPVAFAGGEDALADYSASVQDELSSVLDGETRRLLDEIGVDPQNAAEGIEVSWNALLASFGADAQTALKNTLRPFLTLAVLVLVLSFVSLLVGQTQSDAFSLAALCVLMLQGVSALKPLLSAAATLLHTSAAFVKGFLPVYAGLAAFSGSPAAALSVQTLALALCEGLSACAEFLCVHVTGAYLGVCMACALSSHVRLPKLLSAANKTMTWLLGLLCTVFTGVLGAKTVLSGAADVAGGKSVRFLLSSAIPVVGAAMSDAYSSLVASIHLLRGSIAVIGVLALLALHVPALLQGLGMHFALKTLGVLGDALGGERASGVFQGFALALKFVLLLCVLELFVLLISVGLLLQMKGGV